MEPTPRSIRPTDTEEGEPARREALVEYTLGALRSLGIPLDEAQEKLLVQLCQCIGQLDGRDHGSERDLRARRIASAQQLTSAVLAAWADQEGERVEDIDPVLDSLLEQLTALSGRELEDLPLAAPGRDRANAEERYRDSARSAIRESMLELGIAPADG